MVICASDEQLAAERERYTPVKKSCCYRLINTEAGEVWLTTVKSAMPALRGLLFNKVILADGVKISREAQDIIDTRLAIWGKGVTSV